MGADFLVQARRRAEQAVKDMDDGPLKIAAFETILTNLLSGTDTTDRVEGKSTKSRRSAEERPATLKGRILGIGSTGFFKVQRTLGDVREALGSHGWHYPLTSLSGAMQAIVRQGRLRRERVTVGRKKVWKYSNP